MSAMTNSDTVADPADVASMGMLLGFAAILVKSMNRRETRRHG